MRRSYTASEFATLRHEMAALRPGSLLVIADVDLQPAQLSELDNDKAFVVIGAYENTGAMQFYCIAHAGDRDLAIARARDLVHHMGGKNIVTQLVS